MFVSEILYKGFSELRRVEISVNKGYRGKANVLSSNTSLLE
jgi:hypothetical protein